MFRETFGMRLRAAYLTFHRRANALFDSFGMTGDQFVVLAILAEEDGLTQREVVERVASDANTIGAMLARLEKKGLIRRKPHPKDGRARCVYLTSKGRKTEEQLYAASESLRGELDVIFKPEERIVLNELLARIPGAMMTGRGTAVA